MFGPEFGEAIAWMFWTLIVVAAVSLPFAIWKWVEIAWWIAARVHIGWGG